MPYRFYSPLNGNHYSDVPGNWVPISPLDYSFWDLPIGIDKFDYIHPFNHSEGYFLLNEIIYHFAPPEKGMKYLRDMWFDSERKILCDVYRYQEEGDGKVSVGFADGHVATEDTYLQGIGGSENYASHMQDMYYTSESGVFGPLP